MVFLSLAIKITILHKVVMKVKLDIVMSFSTITSTEAELSVRMAKAVRSCELL